SEDQNDWDNWVDFAVYAYNSGKHSTVALSPNELMMGRRLRPPNELLRRTSVMEAADDSPDSPRYLAPWVCPFLDLEFRDQGTKKCFDQALSTVLPDLTHGNLTVNFFPKTHSSSAWKDLTACPGLQASSTGNRICRLGQAFVVMVPCQISASHFGSVGSGSSLPLSKRGLQLKKRNPTAQRSRQDQEGQIPYLDGWTQRSGRPLPEHVPAAVIKVGFGVCIDLSTLAHLSKDDQRAFRSLVSSGELAVRSQDNRLARGSSCAGGSAAMACKLGVPTVRSPVQHDLRALEL
ncbi:hypothetical protein F442_07248, partial [Phytophthora nicotianae P10297]